MSRALVISGGGSKGAFAVGVLKRLLFEFPGLEFDIFVGTSTGSLIVPFAALGEYELLEQLYTTQKTENIIGKHNIGDRLGEHSIFDANPLWDLINHQFTDQRCADLLSTNKQLYLTTTCLQTEKLTVFTNSPDAIPGEHYETKKLVNAFHLRKAVMASACQPIFMPPVKVNKDVPGATDATHQYVDGGVREYAGVQMAIDNGATEIFTILLSSAGDSVVEQEFKSLFPILEKTVSIFIDDVGKNDLIIPDMYNKALRYIDAVKRKMKSSGVSDADINNYFTTNTDNPFEGKIPLKLFTIRPDGPLGGGPGGLTFDPNEMKNMVAKGENSGQSFIASLNPTDVSWT